MEHTKNPWNLSGDEALVAVSGVMVVAVSGVTVVPVAVYGVTVVLTAVCGVTDSTARVYQNSETVLLTGHARAAGKLSLRNRQLRVESSSHKDFFSLARRPVSVGHEHAARTRQAKRCITRSAGMYSGEVCSAL